MTYVPLGQARFKIEPTVDGTVLTIPAVQNAFIMLFLSVWLVMWTIGGFGAMAALIVTHEPFLAFWLVAWALGWLAVSTTLAWMFTGKQSLRVLGQDLEVIVKMFGFRSTKLYHGREIRQLGVVPVEAWRMRRGPQLPFGIMGGSGAVQFTYGARMRFLAPGMDQAEAAQIVAWLKTRLPEA